MCGLGVTVCGYLCDVQVFAEPALGRRGVTLEELQSGAQLRAGRLGPRPDTARDQAQWRDRRESAALALAAAADWDAVLLSRAVLGCDDDPAKELLIEARCYCPRRNRPVSIATTPRRQE